MQTTEKERSYPGKRSMLGRQDIPQPRYKREWYKVVCFQPVYLPDGRNGCRVYYDNDVFEDIPYRLQWVINDWNSYHTTTTAVLRQQSKLWLGNDPRRRLPLVYNRNLCLIPVKLRARRKDGDEVSGYAVLQKIQSTYTWKDEQQYLSFHSCRKDLMILEKRQTLEENMQLGWKLLQFFKQEHHLF